MSRAAVVIVFAIAFLTPWAFYLFGFRRGREWVWRQERDWWKNNQ